MPLDRPLLTPDQIRAEMGRDADGLTDDQLRAMALRIRVIADVALAQAFAPAK